MHDTAGVTTLEHACSDSQCFQDLPVHFATEALRKTFVETSGRDVTIQGEFKLDDGTVVPIDGNTSRATFVIENIIDETKLENVKLKQMPADTTRVKTRTPPPASKIK